jgi:hypothetical protein
MQITDVLAQMGGLQSVARELGVSESQAVSGAEALIPAIPQSNTSRPRALRPPARSSKARFTSSSA